MFSTFTTSNFDTPLETKTVKIEKPLPAQDTKILPGFNSRSRYGCLTCRKKKKRCDESKPVCGLCQKQKHECNWKIPGTERKNKKRKLTEDQESEVLSLNDYKLEMVPGSSSMDLTLARLSLSPRIDNNALSPSLFLSLQDILNPRYESKIEEITNEETASDNNPFIELAGTKLPHDLILQHYRSPKILHSPTDNLTKGLDEQAIYYLDYYRTCVATTVSIAPIESNYFLNFYLPLASVEKSVLFGVIAWGGMFLNGSKDNVAYSYYMKSSMELYEKKLRSKDLNKNDILVLLTTLTILSAAEICVGDVQQWFVFFEKIHDIIKGYGLQKLIKDFGHANELRWLILNFLYHDVLASRSIKNGTYFKPIEYQQLLQNEEEAEMIPSLTLDFPDDSDGADPLQGCVKPLYMIIGEIINYAVDAKKELEELEQVESQIIEGFDSRQDTSYMITNFECISIKQKKYEFYNRMEAEFTRLDKKITNSKPNDIALSYLNNELELELHLTLFESYQLTAQLYLRMLVLKRAPRSPDMQRLLYNLTNCLDILIGSKVQASLCFPLLVAGFQCTSKLDRFVMSKRFEYMISHFPVMNFKLVKKILDEVWSRNETGEKYIDWTSIVEEFGWDLCVS